MYILRSRWPAQIHEYGILYYIYSLSWQVVVKELSSEIDVAICGDGSLKYLSQEILLVDMLGNYGEKKRSCLYKYNISSYPSYNSFYKASNQGR